MKKRFLFKSVISAANLIPLRFGKKVFLILNERQMLALMNYSSTIKLHNLWRRELERKQRIARLSSWPYSLTIDVTNICNLKCSYCPTGQRNFGRKPINIDLSIIKDLIEETKKYIILVNLFNWGEPLLHPQIDKIVHMLHEARMFTTISTNLNIKSKKMLDKICEAGLDYLIISIDGASQNIYEKYRQEGNLELVFENIAHITEYKRKRKLCTPIIEWNYLVFKHNLKEIELARQLANNLGVDFFRVQTGLAPDENRVDIEKISQIVNTSTGLRKSSFQVDFCSELWRSIVIRPDGGVSPCCHLYKKGDDFGQLGENKLKDILKKDLFITARKFFNPASIEELPKNLDHPCLKCNIVLRQSYLQRYLTERTRKNQRQLDKFSIEVS